MIPFRQVARLTDVSMLSALREVAETQGHSGVFNPSFGRLGSLLLIAYRAIPAGERRIRSFVAARPYEAAAFTVTDLTAMGAEYGLVRVADPKLIDAGDALYVTFNTGFSADTHNDIFVVRVAPNLGEFQRVVADFDRQRIEKNWAFLIGRDTTPMAIYQLHPYREVRLVSGQLDTADDLRFALREPTRADSALAANLSIGTQPLGAGGGRHHLVAHEKWTILNRRSYFGRAVTVDGVGTDDVMVRAGRSRMIHRWQDALPRRTAHNRSLLSATYFSGLVRDRDDLILGYGVNDVDFSIARIDEEDVWP